MVLRRSSRVSGRFHRTTALIHINQARITKKKKKIVHLVIHCSIYNERYFSIYQLHKWCPALHSHPWPVLFHCPLPCLTLQSHEFLMADIVTVGFGYRPQCAIFSTQPSQGGGAAAVGRNMTLRCHSQRPRLAQLLSISRSDQHFSF